MATLSISDTEDFRDGDPAIPAGTDQINFNGNRFFATSGTFSSGQFGPLGISNSVAISYGGPPGSVISKMNVYLTHADTFSVANWTFDPLHTLVTLFGSDGNDTLISGSIDVQMYGGVGDDTYMVGLGFAYEAPNEGNDVVYARQDYHLGDDIESLIMVGGASSGTGNDSDNAIIGTSHDNVIDGRGGADYMAGGAGDDIYQIDNIADAVVENLNEGNDIVHASVDYTIGANVESLILDGTTINGDGNSLGNAIVGNDSDNIIDGKAGADLMAGGKGNDIYFADNAGDSIVENLNEGNDIVHAMMDYTIGANIESLILDGTANLAGAGNGDGNAIVGNSGNNILDGGGGQDYLIGNAGNDTFTFKSGEAGGDLVADFDGNGAGTGDSFLFIGFGTAAQGATFTQFGLTNLWFVHSGLDGHFENITLQNGASVHSTDYLFV